jgi:imidazolonepropionase-like amidohydrolase
MVSVKQTPCALRRACSLAAVALGCAAPQRASTAERAAPTLVIAHVTVIDPRDGSALPDRTVAIREDRIVEVTASSDAAAPAGVRTVDATGKFMIPGLWDMHVHTFFGTWVPGGKEVTLPLFIANGVTGVRDMGSELEPILEASSRFNPTSRATPTSRLPRNASAAVWYSSAMCRTRCAARRPPVPARRSSST